MSSTPFSKAPKSIIVVPSTQTLILRDYAENVARMMEMVAKIDVLTPNSIKPEVIPIKYALASDIASALSALGASGGTSVGKSSSGAGFKSGTGTTGGTGNGFGSGGGGGTLAADQVIPASPPRERPARWVPPPPAAAVPSSRIYRPSLKTPRAARDNFNCSARPKSSPMNGPIHCSFSPMTRT